jgi:ubiquitin C-terminal hydrolase
VEAGIANTTYTKSILDILLTVKDSTDILIDKFGINRMNLIFETIAKLYYDNTNIVYLQSTVLPAITNFIYAKLFTDAISKSSVIL